jgi:hypothetical protein
MSGKLTPLYQLIEERLGGSLVEFVDELRGESIRPPASWRAIAEAITERTGVQVTHTSLRQWFRGRRQPAGAR